MRDDAVLAWLLDGDAAIRWHVMRDLLCAPDAEVAAERARVAETGWGAELLGRQNADGTWGDGVASPRWQATLCSMVVLKDLGAEPEDPRVRAAVGRVREGVTWGEEFGDSPFFEGEVEPCINGRVLGLGAYFGVTSPPRGLIKRLLGEELADGGWNCDTERGSTRSSFHTTICVLEGLLAYEQSRGATRETTEARRRGEHYLLERRLFRRLSTGEPIADRKAKDADWTRFAFPPAWHYDILRGLDYLRAAGVRPDERVAEAVAIVRARRGDDGRWPAYTHRPDPVGLAMEDADGTPSRWNTLRALRVLQWAEGR